MSIYSVNILSVCLSIMLQKALLLMDVVILVYSITKFIIFSATIFVKVLDNFIILCIYLQITRTSTSISSKALTDRQTKKIIINRKDDNWCVSKNFRRTEGRTFANIE